MPSLEKALKKERIKNVRDMERFFDYDGGDIIFDKIKDEDKANMAINHAKELLIKKYKLKESISEALGNDNPSHREKPKMDKDGTVHNIPGKKGGLSAYSIKPRLDGKTLKFGTVDNEGNIKVMTVQELAKEIK
jgi:hypothetical protein